MRPWTIADGAFALEAPNTERMIEETADGVAHVRIVGGKEEGRALVSPSPEYVAARPELQEPPELPTMTELRALLALFSKGAGTDDDVRRALTLLIEAMLPPPPIQMH